MSIDEEYFKLKLKYGERNQEYIWLNGDSANSDLYDIDSAIGSFTATLYSIDEEVPLEEYIQTISTALGLGFSYNEYGDYKKNYENAKKYIDECNKEFSIFDFDNDDTLTYYF